MSISEYCRTNCDDYDYGHSCHKVAGYQYVGKACNKDPDVSYNYFRKGEDIVVSLSLIASPAGCEKGYHSSCLSAGILDAAKQDQNYTRKVPPNPAIARDSYR